MINLSSVVANAVTDLKALTWISPDGTGTTRFADVFNFQHNSHTEGSPFAWVDTTTAVGQSLDNRGYDVNNSIIIALCANWASVQITETDLTEYEIETAKKAEAMLRLREAYDATKNHMIKLSTLESWVGQQKSWIPSIAFSISHVDELNLFRYLVTVNLMEYLRK